MELAQAVVQSEGGTRVKALGLEYCAMCSSVTGVARILTDAEPKSEACGPSE